MRYVSIAKYTYLGTRQCCFLRKNGIDCFYFLIKTAKHFSQAMQAMCGQESWTTAKRDRKICNCYHYGGKTYLWVSSAMNKNRFYCCWVQNTTWHNSTTVCELPAKKFEIATIIGVQITNFSLSPCTYWIRNVVFAVTIFIPTPSAMIVEFENDW